MKRRTLLALAGTWGASAQQVPDTEFDPPLGPPAFEAGKGPVVGIDEGHHNFHTVSGRYQTFARVLRKDGFTVRAAGDTQDVLVVANALNASNSNNWRLPNPPAFSDAEVERIAAWVRGGGALLLISDHQPFPGAASTLGAAFGATFHNGYAVDSENGGGTIRWDRNGGRLREHVITQGVDWVTTFQGSAFRAPGATPLLVFGARAESYVTTRPGQPGAAGAQRVETVPIGGWLQGAVLEHGRGRVAIFGEAAMFSAQWSGAQRRPMGMNAPSARHNARLLVNVARWLVRTL